MKSAVKILPEVFHWLIWTWPLIGLCQMLGGV